MAIIRFKGRLANGRRDGVVDSAAAEDDERIVEDADDELESMVRNPYSNR